MEYLQYYWSPSDFYKDIYGEVLNLIINGIPSILKLEKWMKQNGIQSFKPYYKWNTFNTLLGKLSGCNLVNVLNLIINGIPSILLTI